MGYDAGSTHLHVHVVDPAGRDFETFGQLTMADSNQFHATCLDTYPPIFYLNDIRSPPTPAAARCAFGLLAAVH